MCFRPNKSEPARRMQTLQMAFPLQGRVPEGPAPGAGGESFESPVFGISDVLRILGRKVSQAREKMGKTVLR